MRRVLWSMTVDPEGAMHDWVDLPPDWALTRVPTQEAVLAIGARAYQRLLVDLAVRERPHIVVTHPPYDYLTPAVADEIRAAGTRVVGYAFDDEIFAPGYSAETRDAFARTYDRYVTTREVRWATRPLPALRPVAPAEIDVVLVGRAYAKRVALVDQLRAAGLNVVARGQGWPDGPVSRAAMLHLYARAAIVLTTAGWEDREVPMVKHRLVETAMFGVFQIAAEAPDLRRYFAPREVPSYRDAGDLIAQARTWIANPDGRRDAAAAARGRALAEHTWTRRFGELIDGLSLHAAAAESSSALLEQLLLALATRAEIDGRLGAAAALFAEVVDRVPDEPTAAGGLGRCLRDLGQQAAALPWLRLAAARAEGPAIHAVVDTGRVGTGLGRLALFPLAAEPTLHLIAALVELGRVDEAAQALDAIVQPLLARAVVAGLRSDAPLAPVVAAALARLRRLE